MSPKLELLVYLELCKQAADCWRMVADNAASQLELMKKNGTDEERNQLEADAKVLIDKALDADRQVIKRALTWKPLLRKSANS